MRLNAAVDLNQGSQTRRPTAARRMIISGPHLRVKMKIFESVGTLLSEPFLRKTRCGPASPRHCLQRPSGKLSLNGEQNPAQAFMHSAACAKRTNIQNWRLFSSTLALGLMEAEFSRFRRKILRMADKIRENHFEEETTDFFEKRRK